MSRNARRAAFAALSLLVTLATSNAHAGQLRVNVGSGGNLFNPYAANINAGDIVTWVWVSGTHDVVNWKPPADSINGNVDGTIFDSDPPNHFGQSNQRFSWKSPDTVDVPYVCVVHAPTMSGRVIISNGPAVPVADFRLTEVQFNVAGGQDLIEIANLGNAAGDLRSYRIAIAGTGTGVAIVGTDFPVAAGARVTIHTNAAGTNTATDIFTAIGNLGDAAGSVALYVPSTIAPQNALTNKDLMIDFVQWGAGGQPNETTAGQAGFWTPGTAILNVAAGHSIEYCASLTKEHGLNYWAEISPPNFGGNSDCTTPVLSETWGKLKVIYRR